MGEGQVRIDGQILSASQALQNAGIAPIRLAAKEGLALLNGTQVSTGIALMALFAAEQVYAAAVLTGAMSVDAACGSDAPFDARIHAVRGQPGQMAVAAHYQRLLAGSAIRQSHLHNDTRVQDPYSLRCQPQVMGAVRDVMQHAAHVLLIEANAVSDNPLVFTDTGEVISGGNFHAEPVAFAADQLTMAVSEIGALSERRIALLIDATISGLPAFLVANPGVNSGFMIAHVTAAALASENKTLSHPASVDSCRPRPTRRTMSAWRPSPRASRARWPTTCAGSWPSSCSPPAKASSSGGHWRLRRHWKRCMHRCVAWSPLR